MATQQTTTVERYRRPNGQHPKPRRDQQEKAAEQLPEYLEAHEVAALIRAAGHPVHRAIAELSPGDLVRVRVESDRWELLDRSGTVVGRPAGGFEAPAGMRCRFARVLAIATWDRDSSEPQYQGRLQCDTWEVVVPELVFEREP